MRAHPRPHAGYRPQTRAPRLALEARHPQPVPASAAARDPQLESFVTRGALGGFDHPARYLPTKAAQEGRRAALPAPGELRMALETALLATPFKPGVFEPFLADVDRARHLPALGPADLAGT